ncbi:hypothetical protein ACXYMX_14020 [Sporosarcina sp. CAU 1771]
MNKSFQVLSFLFILYLLFFIPTTTVFADGESDADKKELDISISPKDTLFDISNMKPGDWAPRTITVNNLGSQDFVYGIKLQNNGEKKLYNELLLEIKVDELELYSGKLTEFNSFLERELTSGSNENLDITVRFPEDLGNDFQGQASEFTFTFTAEGENNTTVQVMTNGLVASSSLTAVGSGTAAMPTTLFYLFVFGSIVVASGIVLMIVNRYRRFKLAQ